MKFSLAFTALAALTLGSTFGQEYQGAAKALERLAQATAAPAKQATDPGGLWQAQVAAFQKESATLAPEDAATRWVTLFDEYAAMSLNERQRTYSRSARNGFERLVKALPPPASWEALGKLAAAPRENASPLRDTSLRVLSAALLGDMAGSARARADLLKIAVPNKSRGQRIININERINGVAAVIVGDKEMMVALFEKELAAKEKDKGGNNYLSVPDLLTLAGAAKAKELLQRMLLLDAELSFGEGKGTIDLAAKLALENIAELRQAPWTLVHSIGDVKLYEALAKKFPGEKDDSDWQEATEIYLVGLIAEKRTKEAAKLALELGADPEKSASLAAEALEQLVAAGRGKEVLAFLQEILQQHPELDFWTQFITLSARLGSADSALTLTRSILQRQDLPAKTRANLQGHLKTALLSANQVEEGVKLLQEAAHATDKQRVENDNDVREERFEAAMQLASLGQLLARPEWTEEGVKATAEIFARKSDERPLSVSRFARLLVDLGRNPEAEDLLIKYLCERAAWARREAGNDRRPSPTQLKIPLSELAGFYHRVDRPQDALALFDGAKDWGVGDLAMLSNQSNSYSVPVTFIVANALAAAGRNDKARRVLEACLDENGGYDPAYALLLQLGGDKVLARLEELYARDQFEERPLIWKAKLLLDSGRTDEAEKAIRAAIAVDPSDGEEGKGDRMRAYSILADVLEKKGDAAQAKSMRGAVAAIRISEKADDWWRAGLLSRAVKMYEEALGHFADAYCIQSRLALRYAELGNEAKALEHYRRAYELMPESFGRVESHCFGCEHAFDGERAQGVAEKVFSDLAIKTPNKPQVFYLLGYLREEQGRFAEALEEFRRAVTLDPDYLNAWKKIAELGSDFTLPAAVRDDAALNLLRLDPQGRNTSPKLDVANLRTLWEAVATAAQQRPPARTEVYPLAASKAVIATTRDALQTAGSPAPDDEEDFEHDDPSSDHSPSSPGEALAKHSLMREITSLLEATTVGAE